MMIAISIDNMDIADNLDQLCPEFFGINTA
jgi:hypothetical protein